MSIGSASAMLSVFGGSVPELRVLLLEERLLDGWLPTNNGRYGLTLGGFNLTGFKVWIRMHWKDLQPRKKAV